MQNFLRYIKLVVGNKVLDSDLYNIEFEVDRTTGSEGNSAEITINYINNSTKTLFKQKGKIELLAGYKKGQVGIIFNGFIERIDEKYDSLEILATESNAKMVNTVVNESFTPETLASTIVRKLIEDYGFKAGKIVVKNDVKYYGGRYFTENFKDSMDKMASDTNCIWYEKKGLIYFHPADENNNKIFINANAGLIEFNKKDKNKFTMISKLNHELDENSYVEVEYQRDKRAYLRIEKVKHTSDEFVTECELIDPNAAGGEEDDGDLDWL